MVLAYFHKNYLTVPDWFSNIDNCLKWDGQLYIIFVIVGHILLTFRL